MNEAETGLLRACPDCGVEFYLSPAEQAWFDQRGLHWPKRCPVCRHNRRMRDKWEREGLNVYETACHECGRACVVPFDPATSQRPVLCVEHWGIKRQEAR